jgi:hypothetical protein
MSIAIESSSEEAQRSEQVATVSPLIIDKQDFERRLEDAIRSTQKPIRLPGVRDFFRDVSEAVKRKTGT